MSDRLDESVSKLREELTAYRWLLEDYLRRGSRAFIAALIALALMLVMTVASIVTMRQTQSLMDRVVNSERRHISDVEEHRHRNELLHSCLAQLIVDIIRTSPDERSELTNPCPEPLYPGDDG